MKNFRSTEGEVGRLSGQWARRQSIAAEQVLVDEQLLDGVVRNEGARRQPEREQVLHAHGDRLACGR